MTDRYDALRDALANERVPPGPWERREGIDEDGPFELCVTSQGRDDICEVDARPTLTWPGAPWPDPAEQVTAYIAAADPSTVGALLAERDALAAALTDLEGRLVRAAAVLEAQRPGDYDPRPRWKEASGVRLALSYVQEARR